jgi:hypothetical protein
MLRYAKALTREHAEGVAANTEQGRWGSVRADTDAESRMRAGRARLAHKFRPQLRRYAAEYQRLFADLFRQVARSIA